MIKLNIGCGLDYRDGFVNIDGSSSLGKVDLVWDISKLSLLNYFEAGTVGYILANDIIEHHFHWEAVRILNDFYKLLSDGGECEIRVPDCSTIIKLDISDEEKLILLFGGQDVPQGNKEMDESRKHHPSFFCHKYGWTIDRMGDELHKIGFKNISLKKEHTNLIATATK